MTHLNPADYGALDGGRRRVLSLMMDLKWHSAFEIRRVAGGSEGLRRLRELRKKGFYIEKRRLKAERRHFEYRLITITPFETEPKRSPSNETV